MNMITNDQVKQFQKEAAALMDEKLPKANIMVTGGAGVGKSTLINAIFEGELAETGVGRPVTHEITVYEKEKVPVRIWDTMGLELSDKQIRETIEAIKRVIAQKSADKDPFDRIHAIWYCIQAVGGRFQEAESNFIKELSGLGVPFIIVLTKCVNQNGDAELERFIKDLLIKDGMNDIPIVPVLAKEWEFAPGISVPDKGLDKLVNVTTGNLKNYVSASFIAAQTASKELKRGLAEGVILQCCDDARKDFLSKVPIVNILTTNGRMKEMFDAVGKTYNTNLSDSEIKKIYDNSIGEWKGKAVNLINPLGHWEFKKADDFFNKYVKGEKGFDNSDREITEYEWAAKLIVWSGYSWIFAIEEYWDKLIKANADDRNMIVQQMIERLRNYMSRRNRQEK